MTPINFDPTLSWKDLSPFDHHSEQYEYYIYNYRMTQDRDRATWPEYDGNQQYAVYYGLIPSIDNDAVKFKSINNIISQELYPTFPDNMFQSFVSPNLFRRFYIYENSSLNAQEAGDADITEELKWQEYVLPYVYNWSYTDDYSAIYQYVNLADDGSVQAVTNDPITGIIDITMPVYLGLLCTYANNIQYEIDFSFEGDHLLTQTIIDAQNSFLNYYLRPIDFELPIEGQYNPDEYNPDFLIGGREFKFLSFKLREEGSEDTIYEWKVVRSCWPYALYYVNKYGAIDSLLVAGKSTQTDNQKHLSYTKNVEPLSTQFGKTNYLNEITETWTLNTGLLTEDQASRMHHLLESNYVWLYNIDKETFTPVNITNKSVDYKTYHNQDKKFPSYSITVESSQQKYNR